MAMADGATELIVSSYFGKSVNRHDSSGNFLGSYTGGTQSGTLGMTVGPGNLVYVASEINNQILRYNATTHAFVDVFVNGTGLNSPTAITFDGSGNVLVAPSHLGIADKVSIPYVNGLACPAATSQCHPTAQITVLRPPAVDQSDFLRERSGGPPSPTSMTRTAFVNQIATAVPEHDAHAGFVQYATNQLAEDARSSRLFKRLSDMSGIEHRYSVLQPAADSSGQCIDCQDFYRRGDFPTTGERLATFEKFAPQLARKAIEGLDLGDKRDQITHLIVTCCTGMSAPGLDLQIVELCGLPNSVERTSIGFMGCNAAINALKTARHIVRSEPISKVLVVDLELCSLHLQESNDLEKLLSFLLFSDGCAASLITAEPHGIGLDSFSALLAPQTSDLITWNVRDSGFEMFLSGQVPCAIREALSADSKGILGGGPVSDFDVWAVHPGGRSVLEAVQAGLNLPKGALADSYEVLRRFGNMSSSTVMFVLKMILDRKISGQRGCAMAFGPGLVAETFTFHTKA